MATSDIVGMRANNTACKYHVVWCPKYRRDVLVHGLDVRFNRSFARSRESAVPRSWELEVMPDHVHLLVDVDPQFGIHGSVN